MTDTQFTEAIKGTQFEQDLLKEMSINGSMKSQGHFQVAVQKSAVKLYAKTGIKPNANWKITDVKAYFGIKGTSQKCADTLQEYFDFVKDKMFSEVVHYTN